MNPASGSVGKRKRDEEASAGAALENDFQALLKQHFENSFEPLQVIQSVHPSNEDTGKDTLQDASEPEWEGFSENGDDQVVPVHHDATKPSRAGILKEEKKLFMTAKPPLSNFSSKSIIHKGQPESGPIETDIDAANLQKDIALQRLLKESHLLDSQSSFGHSGSNRHKALDLRLRDLGSKSSIFSQSKMPLSQRRGIDAKATEKEVLRRREAQANGIILEKPNKAKRNGEIKRRRGIGAPSVGKLRGAMLKLSKKDVADIEGPRKARRSK